MAANWFVEIPLSNSSILGSKPNMEELPWVKMRDGGGERSPIFVRSYLHGPDNTWQKQQPEMYSLKEETME